jgi:hypothetical protein
MRRDRRDRFAPVSAWVAFSAVIVAAGIAATQRESPHVARGGLPAAGISGLASPHPPLDRAPGEPLEIALK